MKIYGRILTDAFANGTFLLFKVNTAFMYVSDKRNGLRKVYMDGFIGRQVLIIWIRVFDRAVLYAGTTTRAVVLYNVSGLFNQGDLEVACLPFDTVNFSIGQDLYIGMPADLDQFG